MTKPPDYPGITVIICALNEASNLPSILPRIPEWVDEVLLVDGHSTDRTVEVARELFPGVTVLYQPGTGKGNALKHGFKHARGDIIVTLDADGATDPEEIPKFIEPLLNGYDFAKGSRFLNSHTLKIPWHRRFGNRVLSTAANIFHGTRYTDICSGYNAFWKKSVDRLNLLSDGFELEQELNVKIKKAGLRVIEVPCSNNTGRISGGSKVAIWRQGLKDLITIVRERFRE